MTNEFLTAVGHLGAVIANNLAAHAAAEGVGSGLLFFVFVHTMPVRPPSCMQEYWTWVREALQTLTPARYQTPNPTQPTEEQK